MSDVQTILEPRLATINEASYELRWSAAAIRYRINKGEIAAHYAHGLLLVDIEEARSVKELYTRQPIVRPRNLFSK